MRQSLWLLSLGVSMFSSAVQAAPYMIVGNDEKLVWDDQGKPVLSPAGRDSILIIDLADPEMPKISASLPIKNSIVGPPVNVALTPDGALALVADSIDVTKEGEALKQVPDSKVHVIDLKADPPRIVTSLSLGKQPSGLDISAKGDMALVANRGEGTVSLLSISGTQVTLTDTVALGSPSDQVAAVAFTPDGRRALAVKFASHKVSVIEIQDGKLAYNKLDLPTGPWPYNVAVAPSGQVALTADNGNAGASDGSVDTVSVVDLEASPPRIVDRVVVGDGPEGLAISPQGDLGAAAILRGGNSAKTAFFYSPVGSVTILKIDGKHVTRLKDIEVGGLPEPVCFTPDGRYLYVGNYLDQDFSILKVEGAEVTDTGKRFKVPGHPASARMSAR
ncbi:YncE family protein [Microvirga calopogonii]|uniref:YncE family protein n=1 Tax=Microvirga calopogonii TaxID=2078013 RepID=UPI001FE112FE|nr:YncE family protein [Microvirga calopogonii]